MVKALKSSCTLLSKVSESFVAKSASSLTTKIKGLYAFVNSAGESSLSTLLLRRKPSFVARNVKMLTRETTWRGFASGARKSFSYLDGSWKRVKELFVAENVSSNSTVRLQ